ncbi:hypothetical protein HZH68_016028 [Vespula germanica]|uniref:Uncharacterized protein n=2 Tax=Vespula TaxID=7451 RepID=A0A834MSB1_VESGE|nr:hypothetical protein HZH68_016028 [Vespula germanica]KAF7392331.1 hypothetical protein H0235_017330 [Vespula pensylvanica]
MRRRIIAVKRVRQATDGSGVVLTRRNQARSRSLRLVTRARPSGQAKFTDTRRSCPLRRVVGLGQENQTDIDL